MPDVFWRAILVVADDRSFPPPRQVAASDAASHLAEVTAEVQQRQILEPYGSPFGERSEFGPDLGETLRTGLAHGGQAIASRRA